ncbi:MAG: aldo/keto reductase [Alphaproteobacteria bacterium]|nr:aldo/keto reductase [Alphaproteobacteria bacterium]
MKYTALGRSGLMVSRICLGGNSWGAAGRRQWAAFGIEESRPFFKRALDCGINFFDTADVYNAGESEEIVGQCLVGYVRREDIVISTKGGLKMGEAPNDTGVGRKHLTAAVDASLKRLRTDYIDVYQLHRLDGVTPLEETMQTLADLVRAGKIRYVGGSTMPAWRFAQMIMLADWKGYPRPVAMQNLYNLIQREEEREMNALCLAEGVGLIPYSPLARGFLAANRSKAGGGETERARKDSIVKPGTYRDCDFAIADRLAAIAKARGAKPTQVALAWMLSKPVMAAPIIGATQLHYLDEAAAAVDIALTAEEIASLEAPYEWRPAPQI